MKILTIPEAFLKQQGIKNPKPILTAGMVIIAGVVVYFAVKSIRKARSGSSVEDKLQESNIADFSDININPRNLTITNGQAVIIAQNLLNAMDRWGTDEQSIIDNIGKAKTSDDLMLITQKFGIKPYSGTGLAKTYLNKRVASVMRNLSEWIRAELSGRDLRTVKEMYDKLGVPF